MERCPFGRYSVFLNHADGKHRVHRAVRGNDYSRFSCADGFDQTVCHRSDGRRIGRPGQGGVSLKRDKRIKLYLFAAEQHTVGFIDHHKRNGFFRINALKRFEFDVIEQIGFIIRSAVSPPVFLCVKKGVGHEEIYAFRFGQSKHYRVGFADLPVYALAAEPAERFAVFIENGKLGGVKAGGGPVPCIETAVTVFSYSHAVGLLSPDSGKNM